jgi:hypothetical protein
VDSAHAGRKYTQLAAHGVPRRVMMPPFPCPHLRSLPPHLVEGTLTLAFTLTLILAFTPLLRSTRW